MTKLVIVLAVIVAVILVVVIVAVRNMRAEDPDEFADRRDSHGRTRGGQDARGPRYERREAAERRADRAARSSDGRSAGSSAGNGYRPARSDNGYGDRPDQRERGYSKRGPADYDGRGGDARRGADRAR